MNEAQGLRLQPSLEPQGASARLDRPDRDPRALAFDLDSPRVFAGGDKSNDWSGWHKLHVPTADGRFDEHQANLKAKQTRDRRSDETPTEEGGDLDARVVHATTGEIIRHLTIDPTRRYHGTGARIGGPRPPDPKRQRPTPDGGSGVPDVFCITACPRQDSNLRHTV